MLDTNVLVNAERSAVDLDALIADDDEPAVAAITIAELGVGVEIATGRRRHERRAHDLIIAATARATGRTVITSDAAFDDLPGVVVRRPA